MNPLVCSVEATEDFTLLVEFDNQKVKVFDMKPYLSKGVFQELQDLSYFKQVKAMGYYVCWPHDQDLSHDTLYLEGR